MVGRAIKRNQMKLLNNFFTLTSFELLLICNDNLLDIGEKGHLLLLKVGR